MRIPPWLAPAARQAEFRWRWLTRRWLVVIALGRDTPEVRALVADLVGTSDVVWVTDATTLGRTLPATWVVHRLDPVLWADVTSEEVMALLATSVRASSVIDLRRVDPSGLDHARVVGLLAGD